MKQHMSKQPAAILSILLLSIAIMLSGSAFAAPGGGGGGQTDMATQAELDAVVTTQATTDAGQNKTITSLINVNAAQQAAIDDLKARLDKLTVTPKKIGDHFGGGIVFYVDETGQHGLIASLSDQHYAIRWDNSVYKVTGATGDGVGAGAMNTAIIVSTQMVDDQSGNFAARVAADSQGSPYGLPPCTGYPGQVIDFDTCPGDWYLPSKHELNLLYQQKDVVGGFAGNYYWSSTEYDANYAWTQSFIHGIPEYAGKEIPIISVRAIRAY